MHVKEYEAALAEMKATEELRKLGLDLRWHVARDPKLTPVAVLAAIQAILAAR